MKNPFIYHKLYHYYLVFRLLKSDAKILDYGCGEGEFIGKLWRKSKRRWGVDIDKRKILRARKRFQGVKFGLIGDGETLSYGDESFDAVCMFHVLEHVTSEKKVISEIHRVLKPGGILYLASPYKGMFTWADTANLRFRFPELHRAFLTMVRGDEEYEKRFGKNRQEGMMGDCMDSLHWHKHYKEGEIRALVKGKFDVHRFYKFSLFHPFLLVMGNVYDYFLGRDGAIIEKLTWIDNSFRVGELSYNFLLVAKKR